MILHLDTASPLPPYEQLRAQIEQLIYSGVLVADARLPTIRQLAADLGVAAGTVARAYRELESARLIASRGRHGTFVSAVAPTLPAPERRQRLAVAANAFAIQARQLGIEPASAVEAVRTALNPA